MLYRKIEFIKFVRIEQILENLLPHMKIFDLGHHALIKTDHKDQGTDPNHFQPRLVFNQSLPLLPYQLIVLHDIRIEHRSLTQYLPFLHFF